MNAIVIKCWKDDNEQIHSLSNVENERSFFIEKKIGKILQIFVKIFTFSFFLETIYFIEDWLNSYEAFFELILKILFINKYIMNLFPSIINILSLTDEKNIHYWTINTAFSFLLRLRIRIYHLEEVFTKRSSLENRLIIIYYFLYFIFML